MLLAPALWDGYPLLQSDTGGYLARWYEGYLVPSRSTVFGLYLHFGEDTYFWINLGIQALATMWILQLTLRVFGIARPALLLGSGVALTLTTALPWLASMLLTDIFAGLSVLSLFLLVLQADRISAIEKAALFAFTAFAAATHSATMAVLLGLCCTGWIVRPFLRERISIAGLAQGTLTPAAGAVMLLSANFALSGQLAWTPGGYAIAFGRMLQDGIVTRYLQDHCGEQRLKLCPYRDEFREQPMNFCGAEAACSTGSGALPDWATRWASSSLIRLSNIRYGRRRRLLLHRLISSSWWQPVKTRIVRFPIPTAFWNIICRNSSSRRAQRISRTATSPSARSIWFMFRWR